MNTVNRRELQFDTYADVAAELDRLRQQGYRRLGEWSLAQTAEHLAYYLRGSLEGFDVRLPWLIRKLIGPPVLKKILRERRMKPGYRTIPASVARPDVDKAAAIERANTLLARLESGPNRLHPHPLFGPLSAEQWRQLHLIHAAHHLGFLLPNHGETRVASRS